MRELLEEFGGHEVRTDGDSFTLAFHDALDAVRYCIKVSGIHPNRIKSTAHA